MDLIGFHHLTAVTARAAENKDFYTQVLGMRLVKKTVNQDDVSAYHLFYGDGAASPGSDITFFDWPADRERRGGNCVTRTGFRVAGTATLSWWHERLAGQRVALGEIATRGGRPCLDFEDPEGQRLSLVADDTSPTPHPWNKSPVPPEHQIIGLGGITLTVPRLETTEVMLTGVMNMKKVRDDREDKINVSMFQMGGEGPACELNVREDPSLAPARLGAGGVHHVAFRTPNLAEYDRWISRLEEMGVRSSGPVDRYYFKSLYFREPNGVLFEIATDGPGFATDESIDSLGEGLALPPFLEGRRKEIEAGLTPI